MAGSDIEDDMEPRLRKVARTARIKGFRRGKVPPDVVRKFYGAQIREQSIEHLANKALTGILDKAHIHCATQPVLESCASQKDGGVALVAFLEEYPKLAKTRYQGIAIKKQVVSVGEEDVDDCVERLRRQHAGRVAVQKDKLSGGRQGDRSSGDSAELHLPPLNDEFYARYGVNEGGEKAFRAKVLGEIKARVKNQVSDDMRQQLFDQLLAQHDKTPVPSGMVDKEVRSLWDSMKARSTGGRSDQQDGQDDPPDELLDALRERAQRRVKLGLVVRNLVERLSIKADAESVRAFIEKRAGDHPRREEIISWHYTNKDILSSVESAVIEDNLVKYLISHAKVSEVPAACRDLLYPQHDNQEHVAGNTR